MGLHCDTRARGDVRQTCRSTPPAGSEPRARAWAIALSALDAGRLGIAAAATGLAQSALDLAHLVRQGAPQQFGRPIAANQGLAFLVADMEAAVTSSPATYLHAARLKDAGRAFSKEAAVAKLIATDAAMKVTTDAVQVLRWGRLAQRLPRRARRSDARGQGDPDLRGAPTRSSASSSPGTCSAEPGLGADVT